MKPFFERITQGCHKGLQKLGTKVAESSFVQTYLPKPEIRVVRFPTLEPTTLGKWLGKLAFTETEILYCY